MTSLLELNNLLLEEDGEIRQITTLTNNKQET